jgi:LysM repeat protein
MSDQRLRISVLLILASAVLFTACTRSASTPPPLTSEEPQAGPVDDTEATMDAVRSAILTQTAQVEGKGTVEGSPAPGTQVATSTPVLVGTPPTSTPTATPILEGVIDYEVQAGDWIWKIARKYGVDPQAIIDLSGLTAPNQLKPGMILKIPLSPPTATPPPATDAPEGTPQTETPAPSGKVHVVQAGEWIWQIARTYGVDPQAIIDANNLTDPSRIDIGQELIIP